MADAIISCVVERLRDLLEEEKRFLKGADRQVRKTYNELEKMQELLQAGEPVGYDGNWIVDVKKNVHEAGNVLESYIFQVVFRRRRGIRNLLKRSLCFVNDCIVLKKIGTDVQVIETKISDLNDRLQRSMITGGGTANAREKVVEKRPSPGDGDALDFKGLFMDIELMVSHLLSDNHRDGEKRENIYRVISIYGMDGSGKTTLAQTLYNHPSVKAHFDAMSWTHISHEPQLTEILQSILIDLNPDEREQIVNSKNEVRLVEKLIQVQESKKCLIVLDDVRFTETLDCLKPAILVQYTRTKILLTTHQQDVATHIDPGCFMYSPPLFNKEESLKLLLKAAHLKGAIIPGEIEKLGRKIVAHCGSLPLAIKVIGSILPQKLDTSEWKMFYETMESNARPGVQKSGTIHDVFDMSYRDIPYNLQSCFFYLGNIPRDYEIEVDKLFQLWIAENLISSEKRADGVTMMDVAEGYLNELAKRSLVQVQVDEYTGRIKFCRIPDLIRDVCLFMGTGEEFLQVINLHQYVSTSSFNREIPRLAICLDNLDDLDNYVPPTRGTALHLRSVLFFLQNYNKRSKISRVVETHLTDLKLVRVLDLGGLVFSKLDQTIGELIYLKYLGLRYTVFHELPSTIQNMSYLQTLDLFEDNTQYASIIVPNVFSKLKRLTHLYLRRLVRSNERNERLRLKGLRDLETLENFDSRGFKVKDLLKLTNLRKLGVIISSKSHLSTITNYLQNDASKLLRQLTLSIKHCDLYSEEGQTLLGKVLRCHKLHELSLNGRTGRLPEYNNNFSETLSKLTLESCELKGNPMSTLEKLLNLRSLILKWNAFVEEKMVCSATGFPQLRILQLWRIRNLKDWVVFEGAMPKLSSLNIISCPNLEKIPEGLQFITTLKLLLIKWMPKAFTDRLDEKGEDHYKVQRASIKIIDYDGTEEIASKKTDVKPQRGVVIKEPTSSCSQTTNTPPYKDKGKAPMIDPSTESSSSTSCYEDDDNYVANEMDYIWQLGYPQTTSK